MSFFRELKEMLFGTSTNDDIERQQHPVNSTFLTEEVLPELKQRHQQLCADIEELKAPGMQRLRQQEQAHMNTVTFMRIAICFGVLQSQTLLQLHLIGGRSHMSARL